MLRSLLPTLAALAFLLVGCQRDALAPSPGAAAPALWRVTDADSVVYLFGTVHLLPHGLEWRSSKVKAAFDEAQEVYFETPTEAQDPEAVNAVVRRLGFAPPERLVSAAFRSPDDLATLARAAKEAQVPVDELMAARPWFAAVRLSVASAVSEGHSSDAGVDRTLERDAKAAGKEIRYFESFEDQLGFLADLSPQAELAFLRATMRQVSEDEGIDEAMNAAWAQGDVAALEKELVASIAEAGPEVVEAILTRRNAAWADTIAQDMAGSGVSFVAVGAAHLVGEGSLVEALEERGLEVERI